MPSEGSTSIPVRSHGLVDAATSVGSAMDRRSAVPDAEERNQPILLTSFARHERHGARVDCDSFAKAQAQCARPFGELGWARIARLPVDADDVVGLAHRIVDDVLGELLGRAPPDGRGVAVDDEGVERRGAFDQRSELLAQGFAFGRRYGSSDGMARASVANAPTIISSLRRALWGSAAGLEGTANTWPEGSSQASAASRRKPRLRQNTRTFVAPRLRRTSSRNSDTTTPLDQTPADCA